ncbi:hypothetical protein [Bartonella silvatica]
MFLCGILGWCVTEVLSCWLVGHMVFVNGRGAWFTDAGAAVTDVGTLAW